MELQQKPAHSSLTVKNVAKYSLLPGIFPRLQRLGGAFANILFVFTQIFGTVGLIERDHPCLRPENIGHYRFADIIGYAMRNLSFTRKGIPQIMMFLAVIAAIGLMIAVFVLTVIHIAFPMQQAHAQYFGAPTSDYNGVAQDWVFRFLQRLFGDTGIGAFTGGTTVVGANLHLIALLQGMLRGYSLALLVIAAFMIMYLLIITAVESAKTGQPFGSRFDGAWAPIRLALAISLLIPISSSGYNGAQMVAFQTAEWGSNMASNLWISAVRNMGDTSKLKAFSAPQPDPGYKFIRDYFLIHVCHESMKLIEDLSLITETVQPSVMSKPFSTKKSVSYSVGFLQNPLFCGKVRVANNASYLATTGVPGDISGAGAFPQELLNAYNRILLTLHTQMQPIAAEVAKQALETKEVNIGQILSPTGGPNHVKEWVDTYWGFIGGQPANGGYPIFFANNTWNGYYGPINTWYVNSLISDARFGWATAGVFYLRMSKVQETLKDIVEQQPSADWMPSNYAHSLPSAPPLAALSLGVVAVSGVCSVVYETTVGGWLCPNIFIAPIKLHKILTETDSAMRSAPNNDAAFQTQLGGSTGWINALAGKKDATQLEGVDANTIVGGVAERILEMIKVSNADLNPLGTVVSYGSGLMSASGVAYTVAIASSYFSPALGTILVTLGNALMAAGFTLAIVLPFLPFMYFLFAVVEWAISVLEAVIGMPLWALSFITLEGDALGKGMQGVMMLFEIMLRPTIIILSLIASILVFTAGVSFFNDAFQLYRSASNSMGVETNSTFTNGISSIAQIFIYMFCVYALATASFKLIDAIPNGFMRWIGGPNGFGSQIKSGISSIEGAIAGGAAIKGVGSMVGGANNITGSIGADVRKNKSDKKAASLRDAEMRTQAKYNAEAGGGGGTNNYTINQPGGGTGRGGGGGGRGASPSDRMGGEYVDFEDVPPK